MEDTKHSTDNTNPEFLSAQETAAFLKIKLNTLYALVERGELPFYRIGKRKLIFSKQELIRLVLSSRSKNSVDIPKDNEQP